MSAQDVKAPERLWIMAGTRPDVRGWVRAVASNSAPHTGGEWVEYVPLYRDPQPDAEREAVKEELGRARAEAYWRPKCRDLIEKGDALVQRLTAFAIRDRHPDPDSIAEAQAWHRAAHQEDEPFFHGSSLGWPDDQEGETNG